MNSVFKFQLLFFFSVLSYMAHAQDEEPEHYHHHHLWEAGTGGGAVYGINENKLSPGLHVHLTRNISEHSNWAIGVSLETIFDQHEHYTTGVVVTYRPTHHLILGISPGILFLKEQPGSWEQKFSTHFEVTYEFTLGKLHLGPLVDYALAGNEQHAMIGIHLGIGF